MYDGCYKKNDAVLTWIDAAITAADQDAMLASIHSVPHNRWVVEHLRRVGWFGDNLWLGGNDIALEGTWKNVDGSAANFFFWAGSQPDNYGAKSNCLLLSTNTYWYDDYCYLGKRSLMKWAEEPAFIPECK
jgi:hypothetical protein